MQVLIVDDDMATVDVIQNTVDWKRLEIDQIFISYNISDARRILSENTVDIIISDIEMPQGSGIELLEWIREQGIPGEFLFLTCHESFGYAAKALKNRASEYLLKPFDVNIMEAALKKIIIKIREKRKLIEESEYGKWVKQNQRQLQLSFWNQLLTGRIEGKESQIIAEIHNRKLQIDDKASYRLLISKVTSLEKEKLNLDLLLFIAENIHSEVLCGNPDNDSVVSMNYKENHKEYYVFVTVCKVQKGWDADQSCEALRREFRQLFSGEITICISKECQITEFHETFDRILNLIDANVGYYGAYFHEEDSADLQKTVQNVLEFEKMETFLSRGQKIEFLSYMKGRLNARAFERTLNEYVLNRGKEEVLQAVYTYLGKKGIQASGLLENESLEALYQKASQSVIDMIRWTNFLLESTFEYEEAMKKQYTLSDEINEYIKEHFRENIGRNEIANKVHLAPEYVSKIYKKQTGRNLKDTITEYRIEEAKLLLERGERVSDVAERVGFDNFTYFSTLFKKYTGMPPNQYRKK